MTSETVATVGATVRGQEKRWGLLCGYDWALDTAIDLLTGLRERPDDEVILDGPDGGTVRYGDVLDVHFHAGIPALRGEV
jgi:hypothetical protein